MTIRPNGALVLTRRAILEALEWEPDVAKPTRGELGRDAADLVDKRGSLSGLRTDWCSVSRFLPGHDYRGADLSSADLSGTWLDRYVFIGADLRLATIQKAHLTRCDLRWCKLQGATLHGSNIATSDLRHADLRDVDLRWVTFGVAQDGGGLRGCNLALARLDGADLRGARYRTETIWPDGFNPEFAGAEPMTPGTR